jgi:nucleoside-diphosphate-sugar epimerase
LLSSIKISDNINYIIHGASYASSHYFGTNPVDVLLPNVIGTYHLLELGKSNKIKSFLFFSSGAVYGKAGEVVTEKDYGYLDPLDVKSCYGESKRMAENMCKCWCSQFGIPVKIVRPAHIYGPTMDIENDSRVFSTFVKNIVKEQNIVMKSDGSAMRSFCYIADATVAYFKVLLDGTDGEAYNVGNDDAYVSIKKLAEILISTFPEKQLRLIVDREKNNNYFKSKEDKMFMSSKKVESLGWKCAFSISEGFKRTVESLLNGYEVALK